MKVVFALLLLSVVSGQECTKDGACDKHERCSVWAEEGECLRSTAYMQEHCPASCQLLQQALGSDEEKTQRVLEPNECEDLHERCSLWAIAGECEVNPKDMKKYCRKVCKFCFDEGDEGDEDDDNDDDDDTVVDEQIADCKDTHELCSFWAEHGECQKNPTFMEVGCSKSCKTCDKVKVDPRKLDVSQVLPADIDKEVAQQIMEKSKAFGVRQIAAGADIKATLVKIEETAQYMANEKTLALPKDILDNCSNKHEMCSFWSAVGECTNNRAYMTTNCSPACASCNLIDIKARCPPLENVEPALRPGDLQKMFERILAIAPGNKTLTDEERKQLTDQSMPIYTVHVHSSPGEPVTEISAVLDKSLPPWVVTFENFLTDDECEALIQLGEEQGYKRSEDVGARKFDGTFESVTNDRRTSENAWCSDYGGCRTTDAAQLIHERMAIVTGIPANNSEDLQILRYKPGEFYRTHHDFIPHQVDRQCGPRILTFLLYLSDVEAGGGTNFPNLDITIMPKRGRALLWPSVLNSNPMKKDGRFMHQALDVESGLKYAANAWIHQYDYIAPQKNGCS
ncbi:hypothetical protein MPSEU_000505000 [Mayamaea pseudoterrestris]|nr:hypothetical protein MPSEU_000505000 [Mayamaea pseudoterrestris]